MGCSLGDLPGLCKHWRRLVVCARFYCWACLCLSAPLGGADSEEGGSRDVVELDAQEVSGDDLVDGRMFIETGVTRVVSSENVGGSAQTLADLLKSTSGVAMSFYTPAANRPILRGMDGVRVAVLSNGLNSGDFSADSPDHAVAIEPMLVRDIFVLRGAAALLYGGGAIGGAVDSEPDHIPAEREGLASADVEVRGTFSTVNSGQTFALKSGLAEERWAVRLNAVDRQFEDYRIPGFARTESYDLSNRLRLPPSVRGQVAPNTEGKVPNTFASTRVLALGGAWFGERSFIRGGFQQFESFYGVPLDGHTHGNPYGEPGLTGPSPGDSVTIDLRQHRGFGEWKGQGTSKWMDSWSLKGAVSKVHQMEREGSFPGNDFKRVEGSLHGEMRQQGDRWNALHSFQLGVEDFSNENIVYAAGRADSDYLASETHRASWFSLLEWAPNRTFSLRLGGRADWQHAERTDLSGVARDSHTFSSVMEIAFAPFDNLRAVVSYQRGARLPNGEELFLEAPHGATGIFKIPHPGLLTERSEAWEGTVALFSEKPLSVSFSVFHRSFDGFIFLENQGYEIDGLTAYEHVQREARFWGGEARLRWQIMLSENGVSLDTELFADFVRGDDLSREEALPRMPSDRLGFLLRGRIRNWDASLSVIHHFAQNKVPRAVFGTLAYQSPSAAYTLLNTEMSYSFDFNKTTLKWNIGVSNLLDQEARSHASFLKDIAPLPGRSWEIGLSLLY